MNGAVGRRVYGRRSTERTTNADAAERVGEPARRRLVELDRVGVGERPVAGEVAALSDAVTVDGREARGELGRGRERAGDVPVLGRDERHPLALALDHEPRRHRLHAAGRQSLHHLAPEHRRDLVAVEAVEDPPRLLRVHEPVVDLARLVDRALDRALRDLVEDHAADRDLRLQHLHEVPGDRLALAILVRREPQLVGVLELRPQARDDLLLLRIDDVERLEIGVDVDAEARPRLLLLLLRHLRGAVRKVADVADRRLDDVVVAEVTRDGLRLGGRLDDHESAAARMAWLLACQRATIAAEAASAILARHDIAQPDERCTEPLLAVDGDSLAHRAYHGLPKSIRGAGGRPAGALVGFAGFLERLWDAERPDAVLVGWDTLDVPNYRHEALAGYQAGGCSTATLLEQLDALPELVASFGFAPAKAAGYEADDFLAAAAMHWDGPVLVATSDRDAFQLASERVTILQPVKGVSELARIGPAEVRERYGVDPGQVVDFIALRGDPSDGIRGAPGVGAKTAASLLAQYGSLEAALAAGRFSTVADDLRLYREVAQMDASAPLPALAVHEPTWGRAAEHAAALGLNALSRRLAERA